MYTVARLGTCAHAPKPNTKLAYMHGSYMKLHGKGVLPSGTQSALKIWFSHTWIAYVEPKGGGVLEQPQMHNVPSHSMSAVVISRSKAFTIFFCSKGTYFIIRSRHLDHLSLIIAGASYNVCTRVYHECKDQQLKAKHTN